MGYDFLICDLFPEKCLLPSSFILAKYYADLLDHKVGHFSMCSIAQYYCVTDNFSHFQVKI